MERIRKPFQGVFNIIRFNWHFYALAGGVIGVILLMAPFFLHEYSIWLYAVCMGIFTIIATSLVVSYYIYDVSHLYKLTWLDSLNIPAHGAIINAHAGFDETSTLLKSKYPDADLIVLDFYDPMKHTEVSIKRARKAYPTHQSIPVSTAERLPIVGGTIDTVFVTLAAHEIRNDNERVMFFLELNRILKPSGQIITTEHLRDTPNFLAYNIGFFHFLSRSSWMKTFREAQLKVSIEHKITPFISTFILRKHGKTS